VERRHQIRGTYDRLILLIWSRLISRITAIHFSTWAKACLSAEPLRVDCGFDGWVTTSDITHLGYADIPIKTAVVADEIVNCLKPGEIFNH
jgi:hypothetical protein